MNERISVVVPLYNEEDNVDPLFNRIVAALDLMPGHDHECLLVNDGSTDGTAAAIDRLAEEDVRFRAIHLTENCGQSAALWAGMTRANGDYILSIDGDLQNDPADFPKIIELLSDYDCVCGYRVNRCDTWVRKISSRIANRVRNAILRDGLRDTGCGTKGFRRECLRYLIPFNGAHRFYGAVLRNAGMRLTECPVQHHPRQHGVSKYGIGNRLGRGIYDLIGVAWLLRRVVYPDVEDGP
ncbi:MAG: glycosyltransferase family 2 protein [Candidatus Hydrogenedentes bacterium]|nr:glycosyltransferase family 2 protein [Candidatus Hydrogenedentota bacterium]